MRLLVKTTLLLAVSHVSADSATPATPVSSPTPTPTPTLNHCPVVAENMAYYGDDADTVPGSGVDDCCTKCEARLECNAFTWTNHQNGTCHLMTGLGPPRYLVGALSARVERGYPFPTEWNTLPPPVNCPAVTYYAEYVGFGLPDVIAGVPGTSVDDCCAQCEARLDCGAFSWTHDNDGGSGTCWLKSKAGEIQVNFKAISASVVRPQTPTPEPTPSPVRPTPNPQCPVVEENVEYAGSELDRLPASDANECCSLCYAQYDCNAFTWVNGVCSLKYAVFSTGYKLAAVSARVQGRDLPSPPMCPTFAGFTEYEGFDVPDANNGALVNSIGECCALCQARGDCALVTLINNFGDMGNTGRRCWLKSRKGRNRFNPYAVSAFMEHPQTPPPGPTLEPTTPVTSAPAPTSRPPAPPNCPAVLYWTEYEGFDLPDVTNGVPGSSVPDCCAKCEARADCAVFTVKYDSNGVGTCWLKRRGGRALLNTQAVSASVVRSPLTPPPTSAPTPPPGSSCALESFEFGFEYIGSDIAKVASLGAIDCCAKCRAFSGCRAFSWKKNSDSLCILKGSTTGKRAAIDAISGLMDGETVAPPTPPPEGSCAFEKGTEYIGVDIDQVKSEGAIDCCSKCFANPDCHSFSWKEDTGLCYLKSNRVDSRAIFDMISGSIDRATPGPKTRA